MKADIGFFQEQQPNGKVANSEMRLMIFIPLILAALYLAASMWMYYKTVHDLLGFVHDKIIEAPTFVAIVASFKVVDMIVLSALLTAAFGSKLFQKYQENKALDNEIKDTPTDVKLIQAKTEQMQMEKASVQ